MFSAYLHADIRCGCFLSRFSNQTLYVRLFSPRVLHIQPKTPPAPPPPTTLILAEHSLDTQNWFYSLNERDVETKENLEKDEMSMKLDGLCHKWRARRRSQSWRYTTSKAKVLPKLNLNPYNVKANKLLLLILLYFLPRETLLLQICAAYEIQNKILLIFAVQ
jgi:hypothetical protein